MKMVKLEFADLERRSESYEPYVYVNEVYVVKVYPKTDGTFMVETVTASYEDASLLHVESVPSEWLP